MKNTSTSIKHDDILATLHDVASCNALIEAIKTHKKKFNTRAKSSCTSPTVTVFTIAESMQTARRCEVIKACIDAGVNKHTANTQYQIWYSVRKASQQAQQQTA